MSVVMVQRLTLGDSGGGCPMTLEQSFALDAPPPFVPTSYGVVHLTDSMSGKRLGDADLFPWHRVLELRTYRLVVRP